MHAKATTALFVAFLIALPLMAFGGSTDTFSDMENRTLQPWPRLSAESLLDVSYMRNLSAYMQDHFWQRSGWIQLKNGAENLLGKNDVGGAYLSPEYGTYVEQRPEVDEVQFARNINALHVLSQICADRSLDFWVLPTYSSYTIYPERLPANAPVSQELVLVDALRDVPAHVVDPYSDLLDAAKEANLFFRTDHHWTAWGAYVGYLALMRAMDIAPSELGDFTLQHAPGFYGTLYSRAPLFGVEPEVVDYFTSNLPVRMMDRRGASPSLIALENLNVKDKYTLFLGGVQPLISIETEADSTRSILIVKDSFAHPVVPFMTEQFASIHLIDPRYYKESMLSYISSQAITDVLVLYNISWFAADTDFAAMIEDELR